MLPLPLTSEWRREALRTNLWVVPASEVLAAIGLYFEPDDRADARRAYDEVSRAAARGGRPSVSQENGAEERRQ
jgi:hypothetical protein